MALVKPVKVASGALTQFASDDYVAGFGVGGAVPSGQSASYPPLYVNSGQIIGPALSDVTNAYFDGTNWRFIGTGYATALNHGSGMLIFYQSTASGTAGNVVTFVERWRTDTSGRVGIGRTPSYGLHLASSMQFVGNPSYINVRAFDAVGDGTTDDTAEITAAIAAAVSTGMRSIYFPRGTYLVTDTLTISGDMRLFGDGPSSSVIIFTPATSISCIVYSGTTTIRENEKLEVFGLGFRAGSSNANVAIYGDWAVSGTGAIAAQPCALISNVEIGSHTSSAAFTYGVYLLDASHSTIENVSTYHYQSGANKTSSVGVLLIGGTDQKVRGCTLTRSTNATYFQDTEGVHFNENTVLSCEYGAVWDTTLTSGKPYFDCSGNHFAVGITGISSNEMVQYFIDRNLIYGLRSQSTSATFYGISLSSGSNATSVNLDAVVSNNRIYAVNDSGSFTTAYGIIVSGGSGTGESVMIKGNGSSGCNRLIYLDSSCVNVTVLDDNVSITGDTWEDVADVNSLPWGTYTPDEYGVTNCADTDVTAYEANWTRTGNLVTVFGDVDVNPVAAGTLTTFRLRLPISVNMGAATQLSGTISPSGLNAPSGTAQVHTGTSPDRVEFNIYTTLSTASRFSYCYRFRI